MDTAVEKWSESSMTMDQKSASEDSASAKHRWDKYLEPRQEEREVMSYSDDPGIYARTYALSHYDEDDKKYDGYRFPFDHNCPKNDDLGFFHRSIITGLVGEKFIATENPDDPAHFIRYLDQHVDRDLPSHGKQTILVEFMRRSPGDSWRSDLNYLAHDSMPLTDEPKDDSDVPYVTTCATLPSGGSLTHFHWRDWPIYGKISRDDEEGLFELADNMTQLVDDNRVILKCAMGVGRTGTFGVIMTAFRAIDEGWYDATDLETILRSPAPPKDDLAAWASDRANHYRRSMETWDHLELVDKAIAWKLERSGKSKPIPIDRAFCKGSDLFPTKATEHLVTNSGQ